MRIPSARISARPVLASSLAHWARPGLEPETDRQTHTHTEHWQPQGDTKHNGHVPAPTAATYQETLARGAARHRGRGAGCPSSLPLHSALEGLVRAHAIACYVGHRPQLGCARWSASGGRVCMEVVSRWPPASLRERERKGRQLWREYANSDQRAASNKQLEHEPTDQKTNSQKTRLGRADAREETKRFGFFALLSDVNISI